MKSLEKRIAEIKRNISGFKDTKDRQEAIKYLKSLDPDIQASDIETYDQFLEELKSFFAPLPNTEAWDNWQGTEQHEKYLRRQERKQQSIQSEL